MVDVDVTPLCEESTAHSQQPVLAANHLTYCSDNIINAKQQDDRVVLALSPGNLAQAFESNHNTPRQYERGTARQLCAYLVG